MSTVPPAQTPGQFQPSGSPYRPTPLALRIATVVGALLAVMALALAAWQGISAASTFSQVSQAEQKILANKDAAQSMADRAESIRADVKALKDQLNQNKETKEQQTHSTSAKQWCAKMTKEHHSEFDTLREEVIAWNPAQMAAARQACGDKVDLALSIDAWYKEANSSAAIVSTKCEQKGQDVTVKVTVAYNAPAETFGKIDMSKGDFWLTLRTSQGGTETGTATAELKGVDAGSSAVAEAVIPATAGNSDQCGIKSMSFWPSNH
ncbi:hypothetical protein I6B53_09685 [Schaalia sp. 19OD2882]|uniref:hypothetical protein n=1 Tax=Schaalia sp. 19OD2882 TaxID=2794089 RepID=UPI001C1F07EF|nr:hypothetical protein [Schaalia sp. 19OD2882]QWW19351.1 hypothetical protein I6B53_09685 [Schaalia sp. 19OD2882]